MKRFLVAFNAGILPAFIPLILACCALSPSARAVSPPPDGGYPNNNTVEGTDALFSLTSGTNNSAIGYEALYNNTTGSSNVANGHSALFSNTTGGATPPTVKCAL